MNPSDFEQIAIADTPIEELDPETRRYCQLTVVENSRHEQELARFLLICGLADDTDIRPDLRPPRRDPGGWLTIPCPTCGVPAGHKCVALTGSGNTTDPHTAREDTWWGAA